MADVNRTEILAPKVAPAIMSEADPVQAVQKLAKRVDEVFSEVGNQLRNFEAADASEISGVPASSVISGANSMYFQTFENDITEDWIFHDGTAAAISFPNNGQTGGKALRTTNTEVILEDNTFIPFDASRLYRFRTRYRDVSGTNRLVRVGVRCYDETYTLIGTYQVVCVNTTNSVTSWTTGTGYFKGDTSALNVSTPSTDPSAPNALRVGTRYFRPYIHLSIGGDDQTAEIDYLTLEILTETPETNELLTSAGGRSVTHIASTVKAGGGVAADNVDSDAIEAGAVSGGGEPGATKNHIIGRFDRSCEYQGRYDHG
jgi:hypothetical protein